jgi:hypothetical protein
VVGSDFQPAQPCNLQPSSVRSPFERTARVFGALIVRFFLELRITRSFVKEVLETGLQVPQSLLCRYARNLVQPLRLRLLLELGQRGAGFDVTNSFAGLMVPVRTCLESPVVDEPASPKRARQGFLLLECWVNSEPVAQLHTETVSRVSHNRVLVLALNRKNVRSWASTPTALRNRSTVGGAIPLQSNDRSIPPHAPFL